MVVNVIAGRTQHARLRVDRDHHRRLRRPPAGDLVPERSQRRRHISSQFRVEDQASQFRRLLPERAEVMLRGGPIEGDPFTRVFFERLAVRADRFFETRAPRFTARMNFFEDPRVLERLERHAEQRGMSASSAVRAAIRKYLAENDEEPA